MTGYYPAFLDLRGRRCLVVGGGQVAQRKAEALLQAGARVKVVGRELRLAIRRLAESGALEAEARPYRTEDLKDVWLVIAATDDREVNRAVAAEAESRGLLLNVVDDPEKCNFIAPAVLRRGDLTVAISTGGKSPAVARKVRETLEAVLPEEYGELLDLLAEVRQEAKRQGKTVSSEKWQASITPEVLALVKSGAGDEARKAVLAGLGLETVTSSGTKPEDEIEYRCCGG